MRVRKREEGIYCRRKPPPSVAVGGVMGRARFDAALGDARGDVRGDAWADEMGDVAAEQPDLLDEARGDELEAVGGHQEHRLDLRIEPRIHPGLLELVLEVRDG